MRGMALSHSNKFSARTAPSVIERIGDAVNAMKRRGVKFNRRKVGIEGFAGAVMLEFLAMPPQQQEEVLRRRLPELEALVRGEAELAADPRPNPAEPGIRINGDYAPPPPTEESTGKGKRSRRAN